jgi:hypothetical protein
MKLPRVRFTLRRMMAGIAVAALLVYGGLQCKGLWKTSLSYQRQAQSYAKAENMNRKMAAFFEAAEKKESMRSFGTTPFGQRYGIGIKLGPRIFDQSRVWEARANDYARRKLKFERAAWFPWLPLESD